MIRSERMRGALDKLSKIDKKIKILDEKLIHFNDFQILKYRDLLGKTQKPKKNH